MATVRAGQGQSMQYEGMGAAIKKVRDGAREQQNVKAMIDDAVKIAATAWGGDAHVAFENKYREYRRTLESFIESLNEYATAMEAHMRDTQATDASGAKRFR